MAKLSKKKKSQAKANAKRRGKKVGAYDNLRAAGKKMKPAKKKRK
jgi:hypothetical protein